MNHFKSISRTFQNIKVINTKTAMEKVYSVVTVRGILLDFTLFRLFSFRTELLSKKLTVEGSAPDIHVYIIIYSSKFSEDCHELKILQNGWKVFSLCSASPVLQ